MNVGQAKSKLKDISNSTATKNPKILISELCSVIKFLLDEVDHINNSRVNSGIHKMLPEDIGIDPVLKPWPKPPPVREHPCLPGKKLSDRQRRGNAGDAE